MNVTGLTKSQLFLNKVISDEHQKEIDIKLVRLKSGEPIEYIINKAEFYGLDFYVDYRVLVPRNDTEVMVDEVLKTVAILPPVRGKLDGGITLIDVWTGSSCIPISSLENNKEINKAYVIDVSEEALEVSKLNIKKYSLENKIIQINWDLLEEILTWEYKLDKNLIITANLPYIKNEDFDNMDKETMKYEPSLALYWGSKTGFELYEKLINQCFELKGKWYEITLLIEIWFDQYEYSKKYLNDLWLKSEYFKDNGGIWRCIKIEF